MNRSEALAVKFVALGCGIALVLSGGCSLIPKNVEFFQKKVRAVPELPAKAHETQRQAAQYIVEKTEEAHTAAAQEDASPAVTLPLRDAHDVAEGLSVSLGPPANPWKQEAEVLAWKLRNQKADYERELEKYRARVEPLEGKKIEGTGKINLGYFTYVGLLIGLALFVVLAVKVVGMIYPPVGAGLTGLKFAGRIGTKVLSRGFGEVIEAGESFKNKLKARAESTPNITVEEVLELFRQEHRGAQSRDVQDLIQTLTK